MGHSKKERKRRKIKHATSTLVEISTQELLISHLLPQAGQARLIRQPPRLRVTVVHPPPSIVGRRLRTPEDDSVLDMWCPRRRGRPLLPKDIPPPVLATPASGSPGSTRHLAAVHLEQHDQLVLPAPERVARALGAVAQERVQLALDGTIQPSQAALELVLILSSAPARPCPVVPAAAATMLGSRAGGHLGEVLLLKVRPGRHGHDPARLEGHRLADRAAEACGPAAEASGGSLERDGPRLVDGLCGSWQLAGNGRFGQSW